MRAIASLRLEQVLDELPGLPAATAGADAPLVALLLLPAVAEVAGVTLGAVAERRAGLVGPEDGVGLLLGDLGDGLVARPRVEVGLVGVLGHAATLDEVGVHAVDHGVQRAVDALLVRLVVSWHRGVERCQLARGGAAPAWGHGVAQRVGLGPCRRVRARHQGVGALTPAPAAGGCHRPGRLRLGDVAIRAVERDVDRLHAVAEPQPALLVGARDLLDVVRARALELEDRLLASGGIEPGQVRGDLARPVVTAGIDDLPEGGVLPAERRDRHGGRRRLRRCRGGSREQPVDGGVARGALEPECAADGQRPGRFEPERRRAGRRGRGRLGDLAVRLGSCRLRHRPIIVAPGGRCNVRDIRRNTRFVHLPTPVWPSGTLVD